MSSFQERLQIAIGPRGYDNCMRRSLQSVILYEAKRCIEPRLRTLRPFQRKAAHMDQMVALLEGLTCLLPHQRVEIMWRTGSSKEPLDPEVSWKRAKCIDKDMTVLAKSIKPMIAQGKSHAETVDMLVQHLYESLTGFVGKPHPAHWEHAHNHVVMAFRMYYRYDQLDPTFPPPFSPREVVVPMERTLTMTKPVKSLKPVPSAVASMDDDNPSDSGVAALLDDANHNEIKSMEDRRKILQEVREHLELLKDFEGVVSDEELANRKRELFFALPSAPFSLQSPYPDSKKVKPCEEPSVQG
jgi:hypothetical protein